LIHAPAGNRTRVCTVAGYYSTTRPLVLHAIERQKNLFGNLVPFPFYSILSKLTKIYIYIFFGYFNESIC
jgi:hypothetical protein